MRRTVVQSRIRGVVLPTVLWVTVLTIVIASNYASEVQINTRATDNIKSAMTLKYDATSGVYLAIQKLLANNSNQEFLLNYTINNNSVNIQTFSELQKTSLNDADNRQLYEAFINAGVEREQAERLADRVIDWRDPDSSALLLGMEDNGYRDQGKFYGAKDKRFEDLVELLLIDEIQPEVFQDLADFFTLYGKSSGKLFSISSTANSSDGTKHYQIRAIVHLTFQSNQPYRILKWHYNQG